jgi:hypothetical protein
VKDLYDGGEPTFLRLMSQILETLSIKKEVGKVRFDRDNTPLIVGPASHFLK